jgi:hypothetical protein
LRLTSGSRKQSRELSRPSIKWQALIALNNQLASSATML